VLYHLDLKKYPKSISNYYVIFQRLGMILVIKTNSNHQKKYFRMFTTSISRCLKKNQILAFTYFQVIELTFKLTQILCPIQVVVSSSKRHDYSNLTFEAHYLETLVFFCLHYFLCILYHAFTLYANDNYLFIIDNYISNCS